jgi:protein gp37
MNHRFHREGPVTFRADRLELPLHVKKPTTWAIWSDLFHEAVTDEQIMAAFDAMPTDMLQPCKHTYLILTKRAERMLEFFGKYTRFGTTPWPNVWLGVTAENQEQYDKRVWLLNQTPTAHRFISIEPMLSDIDMRLDENGRHPDYDWGIDWVIVGCETGPKRRPCNLEWIRSIRDQCKAAGVPLWVKGIEAPRMCGAYIGGTFLQHTNAIGPVHVSHNTAEWPEDLRIRQMPEGMKS